MLPSAPRSGDVTTRGHAEAATRRARRRPRAAPRRAPPARGRSRPCRRGARPPRTAASRATRSRRRASVSASRFGATVRSEMNERSATHRSAGGSIAPASSSRTLVRSITVTRGSLRSDHASWPRPTSIATTCAAPRWSRQSVNPPVDAPTSTARAPVDVDAERVERARELGAAARHERVGPSARAATTIGSAASTWRAAVVAGVPLTETRPAAIASTARARLGASPRRTSSTSRRRRTAQRARWAAGPAFFAVGLLRRGLLAPPPSSSRSPSSSRASWPPPSSPRLLGGGLLGGLLRRRLRRGLLRRGLGGRLLRGASVASRSTLSLPTSPSTPQLALHLGGHDGRGAPRSRRRLISTISSTAAPSWSRRELALADQVGRDPLRLRAAQLGEVHARLEHTLPVRRLGHRVPLSVTARGRPSGDDATRRFQPGAAPRSLGATAARASG